MRRRTSRRIMSGLLLAIVLAVALPPFVNLNRYRGLLTEAIGRALGREVTVSNLALRLLPRPGVVLSNFVVADDAAFGAEPMLRADTVTASFRLTSLWRGRLEIGTLDLDNPSLNLVRRADGHWNAEELVERASQVNPAPTARARPETRPRFPYVEGSGGRINFKLGEVKKAFAFTDADFALWLDSDDQWGIRLEARPIRTDVSIADAGTLKLEGRFRRSARVRNTPLYLKLSFSDGPLGQLTRLFYGRDRGWRGTASATAELTGSPAALGVTADAQVDDFRRYDIAMGEPLRLRTHCTGTWSSGDDELSDVRCESPVGEGVLRLRGEARAWGAGGYELGISAERIPAERVIAFASHAKKDLPADLTATGEVEAVLSVRRSPGATARWSGGGQTSSLSLQSGVLRQDLELGEVQFVFPAVRPAAPKAGRSLRPPQTATPAPAFQLVIRPFALPLGAASPATAGGELDADHYDMRVSGPAELGRLLNVAQALGVGTPGIGLAGLAQLDLDVAGPWTGFAPPAPSGKVQVRTATAELQGVSEPLLISSASVLLQNQTVKIASFSAGFSKGTELSGSADFPVHCTGPESCLLQFDIRAEDASLARLNQLLNPAFSHQPWYHLLAIGRRHEDLLLKLRARGRFSAPRFAIGRMNVSNVDGTFELSSGKLRVEELSADLLGGHEDGSWLADFTVSPPRFVGNGTVRKASISQLGALMHDNWATGSVDARFNLTLSGLTVSSLQSSAAGTADFSWSGGSLRHLALDGRPTPIAFSAFAGRLALQDGTFTLSRCKLQSGAASYAVEGTASYDGTLAVRLERSGGQSYVVSGTLDKPHVETVVTPAAEASLR